ncbi:LolA family protein, partial [Streptomyces minutiscleroticus]|uniref:LolA family protein n=1 Tax=Streptomyces minutiscleroticus TaxID=68238 RepID=UPI00334AA522
DRDAYKLLIKPRQSGSTVGAISIAVDARTGTPLKFTLSPSGGGAAVVDAGFTEVDFAAPAASTFDFSPPKGAKVTEGDELKEAGEAGKAAPKADEHLGKELGAGLGQEPDGLTVLGEGWSSVARFETGGSGMPASGEVSGDAGRFLDSLGEQVKGSFGSGTVFSTRLVNALVTDDGTVYAGTVTKETLLKAANAGR